MFNLGNSSSLTAQRNDYTQQAFESLLDKAASDLDSGMAENVVIHVVAKIIGAVVPNTGEGHAASVRAAVSEAVAQRREPATEEAQPETTEEPAKGKKTA